MWNLYPNCFLEKNNRKEATQFLQSNLLDIVFEGKNKSYGAYELRTHYTRRLWYAIFCIGLISIAFSGITFFPAHSTPPHVLFTGPEVHLSNANTNRDKIMPVKPTPQSKVSTKKIIPTIPIIVKEKVIENISADPEEIVVNISNNSGNGANGQFKNIPPEKVSVADIPLQRAAKDFDSLYHTVQVEAQFPGGMAAWQKYLERNLDVDVPMRNGAPSGKYTIQISFIVDKEGNVSNVSALNDPGYGLALEAVRVIQKSKQWLPAIQNGRNVKYMQVQPVTFLVNDD